MRLIDDNPASVTGAGADADLFVNVSFMSHDNAPHERSLYVVHFPASLDAHLPRWQRRLVAAHHGAPNGAASRCRSSGERGSTTETPVVDRAAWTDGDAVAAVH